ncbi:tRNA pseudouridine(38-40) synthase TruA [Candidatus Vallotia lariciata]|uniref:tRNA pseudouridine(38-40) synthase TruA n=1 Tax=Candidatus Vallotia laricis TaxID=2018052 RepID=UPI001D0049AF|nr:tRNA pseudouridine(38-40) synthase TruA [Candidatus Vallotia lariciata]UDG82963.1 tRNA pseudouridine synthase A [Candidatus Vallotia lariciata]
MRIALGLQYEGSNFFGWQAQPHGNTVQNVFELALGHFAQVPLSTIVAGRTDRGVHALGQVVHFDTQLDRAESSWVRGVNAFLPPSIAVQWAKLVPPTFHARFTAFERVYFYVLYVHSVRSPMLAKRAGWVHKALDTDMMREAARHLIGEHDFSSFRSSNCQAKTPIKHLYAIDIVEDGLFVHFRFRANAFLYRMVRNIMGCLVSVGWHKHPAYWVAEVLATRDRRRAAPTFMPDGLYLLQVRYPDDFDVPLSNSRCFPFCTGIEL